MKGKIDLRILFAGCYSLFALWLLIVAQPPAFYYVLTLVFVIASIPLILTSTLNEKRE